MPPGTEPCQPNGQPVQLIDVRSLRNLTTVLGVASTTWSAVFTLGRLYANRPKLGLGDGLAFLALLLNIAHAVLAIIFSSHFRYMQKTPLCRLDGQHSQVAFSLAILNFLGLFFAKAASLLLFSQLFTVSTRMRRAIRVGHAANIVICATSIGFFAYYATPHGSRTWGDFIPLHVIFILYWVIAQGAMGALLDIYIFILPLPVVARLTMSTRERIQVICVFGTAVLGVVGSIVSLVYRIRTLTEKDAIWEGLVTINCNLVEMGAATVVASAPGFAKFVRRHVLKSELAKSLRWVLGRGRTGSPDASSSSTRRRNQNQPRTGRGYGPRDPDNDGWLLKSRPSAMDGHESSASTAEDDAHGTKLTGTGEGSKQSGKAALSLVREPIDLWLR
ncbi:hypothetical protein CDD83_649 [Cordyceps sp. RAO-2017]|nr:hypothetical protein CDD83_649 [Cordyceps sp. RAO-2017]